MAGGLTQFGAYVETLAPGAWSSHRHWHTAEDEFLYMLDGTATLRDDRRPADAAPGRCRLLAPWRSLTPITSATDPSAPVRYLIVGSRAARRRLPLPRSGPDQVNEPIAGTLDRDGTTAKATATDAEPARPALRRRTPAIIQRADRRATGAYAPSHAWAIAGGLTQFGAHLERLPPGSRSSFRHWHETEDEFVLILSGEVILHEDDGETRASPRRCRLPGPQAQPDRPLP